MNERERLMKVLKGETPDRVPEFADLVSIPIRGTLGFV
jgi:hypothetical protein